MSEAKLTRSVVVGNANGLHLRPASLIAKLAGQYQSKIELVKGNERVDCKSIMSIISLVAEHGAGLVIEASGADAEAAVGALAELFASNFAAMEEGNN